MKIKEYTIDETFPMPSFYRRVLEENQFCIVDIETTGLSSKYHHVILIGLLYPLKNKTVVTQIFAEHPREEKELLLHFAKELEKFNFLLTYNGVSFDYPFLKERFNKYNISWPHDEINHFDILYYLKKCKSQLSLDNLKLKTVETFMGINRKDNISGKDSVDLYKAYVSAPSPALEKTILLHNYEDVYYLGKVARIFDCFPTINSLLNKTFLSLSFGNHSINLNYHPYDITIRKNCLFIYGKTTKLENLPDEIHYTPSFDFKWSPSEGSFHIDIPLQKALLINKEKFYYLNLKDFQPTFDPVGFEEVAKDLIHQHLMKIDLSSPIGLSSIIDLVNFIINHLLANKHLMSSLY